MMLLVIFMLIEFVVSVAPAHLLLVSCNRRGTVGSEHVDAGIRADLGMMNEFRVRQLAKVIRLLVELAEHFLFERLEFGIVVILGGVTHKYLQRHIV